MSRFLIAILLFALACTARAQNVGDDYERLSVMSSEELMDKGREYLMAQESTKALPYFLIVSERYKSDQSREAKELSIRALNNIGLIYKYFIYDYPQSYDYLMRAYELSEESGFADLKSMVMVNLGDLLNDYGVIYNSDTMKGKAEALFDQSFRKAFESRDWRMLTTSFFNLSCLNYDLDLGKYSSIFSKEIPENIPHLDYIRMYYKGVEAMQRQNMGEAREYFGRQLSMTDDSWAGSRYRLIAYLNLAETYRRENNPGKAAEEYKKALAISEKEDIRDLSAHICGLLSEIYTSLGNEDEEKFYHKEYVEKISAIHNSRLSMVAEMNYLNDLRKEEENRREAQLKQRAQQYLILGVIIILLVVIFFTVLTLRQNRRLREQNRLLFERYQNVLESTAVKELKSTSVKEDAKYSNIKLTNDQRKGLVERIGAVLEDADTICSQDFSLKDLAKMVDSNTTYVSRIINEDYGMTFANLLGNRRVREACRRINDDRYANITIEAIANNVGFKSRTAFLNAFKREVGISPSEYIRMARIKKEA